MFARQYAVSELTEFGVKVSAALADGYVRFEEDSFDPYNESAVLQKQVEGYRARYGRYPESGHADKFMRKLLEIDSVF